MTNIASAAPRVDTGIISLNQAISDCIKAYLDIEITFDLPAVDEKPDTPTVSIFLFDVHEDLELRHGGVAQFGKSERDGSALVSYKARVVNITCRYLITYWGTIGEDGSTDVSRGPSNQGLRVMNAVLNALLNKRRVSQQPGFTARVIPPMDLQNLGTFWQALGNRPRLCLGYDCTIPFQLSSEEEAWSVYPAPEVKVVNLSVEDQAVPPAIPVERS